MAVSYIFAIVVLGGTDGGSIPHSGGIGHVGIRDGGGCQDRVVLHSDGVGEQDGRRSDVDDGITDRIASCNASSGDSDTPRDELEVGG